MNYYPDLISAVIDSLSGDRQRKAVDTLMEGLASPSLTEGGDVLFVAPPLAVERDSDWKGPFMRSGIVKMLLDRCLPIRRQGTWDFAVYQHHTPSEGYSAGHEKFPVRLSEDIHGLPAGQSQRNCSGCGTSRMAYYQFPAHYGITGSYRLT